MHGPAAAAAAEGGRQVAGLLDIEGRVANLVEAGAGVRAVGEQFLAHRGTGRVVGQKRGLPALAERHDETQRSAAAAEAAAAGVGGIVLDAVEAQARLEAECAERALADPEQTQCRRVDGGCEGFFADH